MAGILAVDAWILDKFYGLRINNRDYRPYMCISSIMLGLDYISKSMQQLSNGRACRLTPTRHPAAAAEHAWRPALLI